MNQNLAKDIPEINLTNLLSEDFLTYIKLNTQWDETIRARKTASFGVAYNYSGIEYSTTAMPHYLNSIIDAIALRFGYRSNNCLINFYDKSMSSMGYHSDRVDILDENTGIAILSLGGERTMRFKNKISKKTFDMKLKPNHLIYMTKEMQYDWMHSIVPISDNELFEERISLTFRKILNNI